MAIDIEFAMMSRESCEYLANAIGSPMPMFLYYYQYPAVIIMGMGTIAIIPLIYLKAKRDQLKTNK